MFKMRPVCTFSLLAAAVAARLRLFSDRLGLRSGAQAAAWATSAVRLVRATWSLLR